jgi:HemY protein
MRRIVWFLLVVSGAVGIALLMRLGNGNVAIFWPPYRLDLSVNLAVLILVLLFVILHLLFGFLSSTLRLPSRVRGYLERRHRDKAIANLRDGLLALFEGRYGRAERLAKAALSDPSLAGTAALIGAKAAHGARDTDRRDQWFETAQSSGNVDGAWAVAAAEIALEEGRPAEAIELADGSRVRAARTLHALSLVLRAKEKMHDWPGVLDTLRQFERRKAIDSGESSALRIRAILGMLGAAGSDPDALTRCLDRIDTRDRESPEIAGILCKTLIDSGREQTAARLIEKVLASRFDAALVLLWPRLHSLAARDRLARCESWLQRWGDEPELLTAMGRVCASEGLWGKAESFLLRADRIRPEPQLKVLLACVYQSMGRDQEASGRYREAALLAVGSQVCDGMAGFDSGSGRDPDAAGEAMPGAGVLPLPGP